MLMRSAVIAVFLLVIGCSEAVTQKQGDPNDKRYFSSQRFVNVEGLPFPDYAKFAGWIGRHIEIQPVYEVGDPSWFRYELYYEDFENGQAQPIATHKLADSATGILRNKPRHLLCVRQAEKDDRPASLCGTT